MNSRRALFGYNGGWILEERHRRLGGQCKGCCKNPRETDPSLNFRGSWLVVGRRGSENPRPGQLDILWGRRPKRKNMRKSFFGETDEHRSGQAAPEETGLERHWDCVSQAVVVALGGGSGDHRQG